MSQPPRGVRLRYTFEPGAQAGADIDNPLFDLLSALREQGSIQAAARALGQSYRHVWGALKHWEQQLGRPLVHWERGQPARLTPFAERLLWAERQARSRLAPQVQALRRELQRVFTLADDPAHEVLELAASHDLALPLLLDLADAATGASADGGLHLGLRFTGSEDALRALRDGRCTVAGFHVPRLDGPAPLFRRALRPLLTPGTHKLIGSHWRRQGLMHRPGTPPPALADLVTTKARPALRFVQRQPGSGTRLLLGHLLLQQGLDAAAVAGTATRVEHTHLAVAATIASGGADTGLGIEAAAVAQGLDFVPLAVEDYFLVCLRPALDTSPLQALRALLATPAWAQALHTLPGYGPQRPGEVLSLTRALPWWRFRPPSADAG